MALPTTSWSAESLPTTSFTDETFPGDTFVDDGFVDDGFVGEQEDEMIANAETLPTTTWTVE